MFYVHQEVLKFLLSIETLTTHFEVLNNKYPSLNKDIKPDCECDFLLK